MNKRILLLVFTSIILFLGNSQVFAEIGEKIDISEYYSYESFVSGTAKVIQTDKIIFEIGKRADVHVKHIVTGSQWNPDNPKLLETLPGKHSNLQVTDEDGDYLRPIGFVGETFEESKYVILGQKSFAGFDLVMEYDLENFLELNEDGIWIKHFKFPHDVMIYFDDEIELIFANSRPVDTSAARGINCMGCSMILEFFDETDPIIKKVYRDENKLEEISNTGEEFIIEFFSNESIDDLNYLQELNYFSFSVKENQLFSVKIPLDLLLSPYHVYLTENDQEILVEGDKIRNSEYGQTETHANVSFRAETEGIIHVVGSTQMEHEKLLDKLESRVEIQTEKQSDSIFDAVRNQDTIATEDATEDAKPSDLYEDWVDTSTNNNGDNTIIFIIVGVVAIIIIGIIIKFKKN